MDYLSRSLQLMASNPPTSAKSSRRRDLPRIIFPWIATMSLTVLFATLYTISVSFYLDTRLWCENSPNSNTFNIATEKKSTTSREARRTLQTQLVVLQHIC